MRAGINVCYNWYNNRCIKDKKYNECLYKIQIGIMESPIQYIKFYNGSVIKPIKVTSLYK